MRLHALAQPRPVPERRRPLLLYDARCGICRRFVSVVIHADRAGTISIAPLVGSHGDTVRREYRCFGARDSAVWIPRDGPALAHAEAILAALDHVGGVWSALAAIGRLVPRPIRTAAYRWFVGHRRRFAWLGLRQLDPAVQSRTLPETTSMP